jgi:hypothetical protein
MKTMEELVLFDMVKRSAMVVKPKMPFIDWVNTTYPDDLISIVDYEDDVYLLPEFEEKKQMEGWLKQNFDQIFIELLNQWSTDENDWPKNRTVKMFKEWFDYSMHTMIWDTIKVPINKI